MKKLLSKLRSYILMKLNAVSKETYDRECSRLGVIIERHIDDETWLLTKLNIPDHAKVRKSGCYIDRQAVNAKLIHAAIQIYPINYLDKLRPEPLPNKNISGLIPEE